MRFNSGANAATGSVYQYGSNVPSTSIGLAQVEMTESRTVQNLCMHLVSSLGAGATAANDVTCTIFYSNQDAAPAASPVTATVIAGTTHATSSGIQAVFKFDRIACVQTTGGPGSGNTVAASVDLM